MKNLTLQSGLSKEIFNVSQKFHHYLSKPQQRNFREIMRGMILTGSVFLNQIAEVNSKEITDRKNTERLSKTLSKIDINNFHRIHINSQIKKYQHESVLIFADGGDLQKPHAKKMEMICKNIDGSNGHKVGKGYPIFSLLAYGTSSQKMTPLAQHLWSTKEENYKSDWCEHQKIFIQLDNLVQSSCYDRIIIEDRGCDDIKRFNYFLNNLNCSFITRISAGNKSRNLITKYINKEDNQEKIEINKINVNKEENEIISVKDLAKKIKSNAKNQKKWKNKKLGKILTSSIAFQKVYLPELKDKENKTLPLYAILIFTKGFNEPMVLLTDLKISDYETAWKYFFYYKKRWEIENFFRAEKQNFNAEKFLIRGFKKIKALILILMLVFSFLLELKQKIKQFLSGLYQGFLQFCKKKKKTAKHHLDLLAFLRDCLADVYSDFSYRFCSRKISKYRSVRNKDQIKLIDFRKKW